MCACLAGLDQLALIVSPFKIVFKMCWFCFLIPDKLTGQPVEPFPALALVPSSCLYHSAPLLLHAKGFVKWKVTERPAGS